MTLIKNWDLSTGNLSQITGGYEYVGATTGGVPSVASRCQVYSSFEGITAPGGGYFMRFEVRAGDKYGGSNGERFLFRPDTGSGPYGLATRQSGYDSTSVWAQNMPTGWPNGANVWVAGCEWHHTGGQVAPSHHIAFSDHYQRDVFGGNADNKTTYVNQSFLPSYTKNTWYIFCERYRHGLAPNGHFELWVGKYGTDSTMTRVIYAPNIGTMYAGYDNYQVFGHYRQEFGSTTFMRLSKGREYSSLTEGLAYANGLLGGTTPTPDPPPAPPPTSTIAANTRDRRVGRTTIGSQRYGFASGFMSASKIVTGLGVGEEGDAYDFHIPVQGGDNTANTQHLQVRLYDDTNADGAPDVLLGTCSVQIAGLGNQNMTWMKVTSGSPIRFTGQNVWLCVTPTDGPTNRTLFATDDATAGLAYATPAADPYAVDGFIDYVMTSAFDYDVVAGTPAPPGDTTAPTLSTATITARALVLSYNEPLDTASTPATTDFVIKVNTTPVAKTSATVSGSTVTIVLTAPVIDTDTVTRSYTAGTNPVQDVAGNNAGNYTDAAVTNNTPDVSDPATTGQPGKVDDDSYLLRGTVNPNGVDSVAYFEYGPTTAYELGATAPQAVGAGTQPVNVEQRVDDLAVPGTYHYRVVRDDA